MKDKEHRQKQFIKKAIDEYIKRGDYKLAIEECKKYLSLPGILSKDYLETKKKMADLYEKIKDYNNMIKEYLEITDIYIKEGFASKAPPLLRKAITLSPQNEKILEKMAEVYQTMGWKSEMVKTYLHLIDLYAGRKEHYKAVDTYKKLIEIDPGNIQNRVKFIEYLIHIGYTDEAREELNILLEKFETMEDKRLILPLFKKAPNLFPDKSLKIIAEGFYANGEYKAGINVIKSYWEKTGKKREADVFELLAYGFKSLGDKERYLTALRGLIDIYRKQNDIKKLRDVYERILEIDPENQEAKAFISKAKVEKEEDLYSRPPSLIKSDALSMALTKLDIYLKFPFEGYKEKAEEILRKIDILSIEDEIYLDRIMKICERLGHKELFSLAAYRLADLWENKGNRDMALKFLNLSISAWPDNRLAQELFSKISPKKEIPEEEIVTEVEIEEVPKEREEIRMESEAQKMEIKEEEFKVTSVEEIKDGEYDLEKALIHSEEFSSEQKPPEEVITEPPKYEEEVKIEIPEYKEEEIKVEMPEYRESREEIKIEMPEYRETPDEEIKIEIPEEVEVPKEEKAPEKEISFEVEERGEATVIDALIKDAQFFKEIGDIDTLKETCNEILKIDPKNPFAIDLLKEIETENKPVESLQEVVKEVEKEEDEEILKEVLEEFKKKVNEVCSQEDTATHYELGHAYMEMGLWDEAIREFKISASDPLKRGTSYSLITRCYARKGDVQMALEFASKALSEKIDDEGKAMIKKELGDMMRKKGEIAEALNYYKEALSLLPKTEDDFRKKEKAEIEKIILELEGEKREEITEEPLAEVKDITSARRKKKIHYM
jgi:tetratricopeptide (TPR) repeat protein